VVDVHLSNRSVQRITWRRDKVREYSIKGYTQRDIAAELQISTTDSRKGFEILTGTVKT
jgi:FixJ family two-component response regulator